MMDGKQEERYPIAMTNVDGRIFIAADSLLALAEYTGGIEFEDLSSMCSGLQMHIDENNSEQKEYYED